VERVVNSVTQTESDPKPKDNWKYYKYGLYALGILTMLYGGYYYWDDYTKPILTSPWYVLRWCYCKVRGKNPRSQSNTQPNPYEPDYAGLESGEVPSTSSAVETTRSGFFSIFNRVDKGKSKDLRDAQPKETIFSVGELSDPFSETPGTVTPTPSTSRGYSRFDSSSSLSTNKNIKNK